MINYIVLLYRIILEQILEVPGRLIALIFFLFILGLPLFINDWTVLHVIMFAAVFAIYAASWDVLAGFAGQLNLGHALFFGVSAYAVGLMNKYLSGVFPLILSPLVTIIIGSICGVIVGMIVAIPAMRLRGLYLALVTIAFPIIITGFILFFQETLGGEAGLYGIAPLSGSRILNYYIVNLTMIVSLLVMWKLTDVRSKNIRTGIILRAIQEDEIACRMSGINTAKYKLLSFAVSGFFAGIAGGLYAHLLKSIGPTVFAMSFSFEAILWTIFGGLGTIYGPVAGVFILYPIQELLALIPILEKFRYLVNPVLIMLVLLFMPQGFCIKILDKLQVQCQRCKIVNSFMRRNCRACNASLRMEMEEVDVNTKEEKFNGV